MQETGTTEKGRVAEEIASKWLEAHGLEVLERNWRHHHLELDIIAEGPMLSSEGMPVSCGSPFLKQDSFLHIVEVRSRKAVLRTGAAPEEPVSPLIAPQLTVDYRKRRFLVSAADAFVRQRHIKQEVVFDIVSIVFSESSHVLSFYPDAFHPLW